jgi:hypothetical protein
MIRLTDAAERRGKWSDRVLWPKIEKCLRSHVYRTLTQLAHSVVGYYTYNFVLKDLLKRKAKAGAVAIVGYAEGKRVNVAYCLPMNEEATRRSYLPQELTKDEVRRELDTGPKCALALRERVSHPSQVDVVLPMMLKGKGVRRAQIGVRDVYALAGDSRLEEMRERHTTSRLDLMERSILTVIRRYPGCSASTIEHALNKCGNRALFVGVIRSLTDTGVLRRERRGLQGYRYWLNDHPRCPACGQRVKRGERNDRQR